MAQCPYPQSRDRVMRGWWDMGSGGSRWFDLIPECEKYDIRGGALTMPRSVSPYWVVTVPQCRSKHWYRAE
jgi:hypothetical protein